MPKTARSCLPSGSARPKAGAGAETTSVGSSRSWSGAIVTPPRARGVVFFLHQQLKETKSKQAQNTYTAHTRTLKEEKSTKVFYQPFNAKHASGDIPELLHTPNWNSPEAKFGTVDTPPKY
eukprot:scaffold5064_cov115-Isochrysis_galbana.AAC.17